MIRMCILLQFYNHHDKSIQQFQNSGLLSVVSIHPPQGRCSVYHRKDGGGYDKLVQLQHWKFKGWCVEGSTDHK